MTDIVLPKLNQTGKNEWGDVESNDVAIREVVNGELDNANLSGSAGITDANLASPNNSAYRVILQARGWLGPAEFSPNVSLLGSKLNSNARMNIDASAGEIATQRPPDVLNFDDADYAVAGKTTKLRLRVLAGPNSVAPEVTLTFGLYPCTPGASSEVWHCNTGTVVSGSTVAIVKPAASTYVSGVGSDFAVPADGAYVLGVVASGGTSAAGSVCACHAQLQVRWV